MPSRHNGDQGTCGGPTMTTAAAAAAAMSYLILIPNSAQCAQKHSLISPLIGADATHGTVVRADGQDEDGRVADRPIDRPQVSRRGTSLLRIPPPPPPSWPLLSNTVLRPPFFDRGVSRVSILEGQSGTRRCSTHLPTSDRSPLRRRIMILRRPKKWAHSHRGRSFA